MGLTMAPMPLIRVVLVDDAPEVRMLVRTRLRIKGGVEVVAEGADGYEAVRLAAQHQPDAMLLDVSMPGLDGFGALPRVIEASPKTRVVMFTGFAEDGLASRAMELGASSLLMKSCTLDDVVAELVHGRDPGQDHGGGALGQGSEPFVVATDGWSHDGGLGGAAGSWEDAVKGADVLQQHVERFRGVFEDAAIGMATMTLAGRIVRANDALCRILGRDPDDLLGSRLRPGRGR